MDKYLRNKKIKIRFKEDLEPQEILLDSLAQRKEEELGISEKKLEVPILKKILQGLFFISFALIFILFLKTFQLQIIEGKNFTLLAEGNKFKIYQIQAERGVIYDQKGNQLVFNSFSFDLILDKKDFNFPPEEELKILKEVSEILKKDIVQIKRKIGESESNDVLIAENLDYLTHIILETKIANKELPGFKISQNWIRNYKDGPIFSHLLGYTGKITPEELKEWPEFYTIFDWVGRSGIEKSYEEILRKNPGKIKVERDALGNIISQEIIQLPESGKSLVLWLDSDLQKKIRETLEKQRQTIGARAAAAVALDPQTGGVLALVSLPDFDNNLFQKEANSEKLQEILEDPLLQKPLFNRAIAGQYLIGSVIKPLIALAALEEKIISPEKKIYDPGFIEVPHRHNPKKVHIFKDWTSHGWTDLRKAIAESCNVYFYTIGGGYKDQKGLGPTKIKKYLELFGWGQILPIDLPMPKDAMGLVPDPTWKKKKFEGTLEKYWWDGDTYNLSIGQGYILVTPLQVATAFSVIANKGKLLKPQVVQKIINSEKNIIEEIQPTIIRDYNPPATLPLAEGEWTPNFISSENLQIVREGMRWAVTGQNSPRASAISLNELPVKVAAKTGTAQIGEDYYNIWITLFAPYEDPQIVLTLVIEKVKGLRSQAIISVAKEILNWYFSGQKF